MYVCVYIYIYIYTHIYVYVCHTDRWLTDRTMQPQGNRAYPASSIPALFLWLTAGLIDYEVSGDILLNFRNYNVLLQEY